MDSRSRTIEFHDAIAPDYDTLFSQNGAGRWIRERVQRRMLQAFEPDSRILELNCGTGTDAVFLGMAGMRVLATDVSPGMVQIATSKVKGLGLEAHVSTAVVDAGNLSSLEGQVFDGVVSNFNGLNHLEDPGNTFRQLSRLVKPGGKVLCTVLNKACLWEVLYFAATLRLGTAWKRLTRRASVIAPGNPPVQMKLYFPVEFTRLVGAAFRVARITGFGILLPPTGFERLYSDHARLLRKIEWMESHIASLLPFYLFSDHFLVELERRP